MNIVSLPELSLEMTLRPVHGTGLVQRYRLPILVHLSDVVMAIASNDS